MIDYKKDTYEDIVAKDGRYASSAYAVLMDIFDFLKVKAKDGNVTAAEIMDEFRETVLDEFGPLSFCVLEEWGVTRCEDRGEMMFNLADARRVTRTEEDTKECFIDGYDFREAFLAPFEPR